MVYKVTLIPLCRRFGRSEIESVVVSFASDSLPDDIDFSSDLAAKRMLLDFLRVCGYRLTDYVISTVERYNI